jgi:hypothetical protein
MSNFKRTGPVQFRLGVLNATDDYRIDNAFTIHRRPVHFNSRLGPAYSNDRTLATFGVVFAVP